MGSLCENWMFSEEEEACARQFSNQLRSWPGEGWVADVSPYARCPHIRHLTPSVSGPDHTVLLILSLPYVVRSEDKALAKQPGHYSRALEPWWQWVRRGDWANADGCSDSFTALLNPCGVRPGALPPLPVLCSPAAKPTESQSQRPAGSGECSHKRGKHACLCGRVWCCFSAPRREVTPPPLALSRCPRVSTRFPAPAQLPWPSGIRWRPL